MDPLARGVLDAVGDLERHGGQLFAAVGSSTTQLTAGEALAGEALTDGHVFNVYCAARPLAVMATLAALDAGPGAEPATPLADLVGVPATTPFGALTLADLLAHRTQLAAPDVFKFLTAGDGAQAAMLHRLDRSLARRRRQAEPSTLALAHVLSRILQRAVGAPLAEVVEAHVAAVGLTRTFVRVEADQAPIGVYVDRSLGRYTPLLHDRMGRFAGSPHLALAGAYTCAADLGRWATELLAVLRGTPRPGFPPPELVRSYLGAVEPAPGEEASFAAGLAVGLPDHGLTAAGPAAVSHFGFVRSSLVFVDPDRGIVLAGIHTDLSLDDLDGRRDQWNAALAFLARSAA